MREYNGKVVGKFDVFEFINPRNKVCILQAVKRKTFLPLKSAELVREGILKS